MNAYFKIVADDVRRRIPVSICPTTSASSPRRLRGFKCFQILAILGAIVLAQHPAGATLYQSGALNIVVPDNNLSGISSSINVSSAPFSTITDVNVPLTISGGYNGDLYAYLTHDGATAILLNRIGTTGDGNIQGTYGFNGAGMNAWLDDAASDIHTSGGNGFLSGTYGADGRNASPNNLSAINSAGRTQLLNGFNNQSPSGSWTLFVADANGGAQSTLSSWEMEITGVPEPVNVALGIFGGFFVALQGWRWWKQKSSLKSS